MKALLDNRGSGFVAESGASHRGLFLACDLIGELQTAWSNGPLRPDSMKMLKVMFGSLEKLASRDCEFHFLFDGKSRECRKILEESLSKQSETELSEI